MASPWPTLDAIPLGICVVDESGRVVAWNCVLATWTGTPPDRAIGRQVEELLDAFSDETHSARLNSVLTGGPPAIFSSHLHGQPHTTASAEAPQAYKTTVTALAAEEGRGPHALISMQDISAQTGRVHAYREKKDEALREATARKQSEMLLRQKSELLELFSGGFSTADTLKRILECIQETAPRIEARILWRENPREEVSSWLGELSSESELGRSCLPLKSAATADLGQLQIAFPTNQPPDSSELKSLSTLAKIAGIAIERGHDERSRSLLSAIVRSNSDAIIGYALDGTIESWNASAVGLLGFEAEEVLGKPFAMLADSATHSELHDILLWAMKGNTYNDLETEWSRKDGTSIALSLTLSPILGDDEQVLGTAIIARDITERKRHEEELLRYTQEVEEHRERVEHQTADLVDQSVLLSEARDAALKASKVKAEFLSTMSHEIRTPMNGIIGMTEVLMETELDEEQLDCARTIQTSGESLLAIINDILDLSKIEAGKLTFEYQPFDLRRNLHEVVMMTRLAAQSKGIELELHWDPSASHYVESDSVRIRQVIMNLVSNALKFTSKGGVSVHVTAEDSKDGIAPYAIEVRDTGIGISEEQAGKIFEAFQQADSSTTRRFGGTGLGLAICKRICKGLGGDVSVTSVVGEGSVFRVELPLRTCTAPVEQAQGSESQAEAAFDLEVLLVEDNRINQKVACAALKQLGCKVEIAENGREAIERLELQRFDLIFMDCQMPIMNGYDATGEIRERGIAEGTPILAMTANAMPEDRARCLAAGMDGYLAKPFKRAELRELITEQLYAGEERAA